MEENKPRPADLTIREDGILDLLRGLGDGGFCSGGMSTVRREGTSLIVELCANAGKYDDRIKAVSMMFVVELSPEEQKVVPARFETKEKEDEVAEVVVPAAPAVPDPGMPG